MKHLTELTNSELSSINGGGFFEDFSSNIMGLVNSAFKKDWSAVPDYIIGAVSAGFGFLGSLLGLK